LSYDADLIQIYLAMEEKEDKSAFKAQNLISTFDQSPFIPKASQAKLKARAVTRAGLASRPAKTTRTLLSSQTSS
jgi:hypothetical protein